MFIGDMDISMSMVYVQQVEEEKLRDKEEFRNKRVLTLSKSLHQKGNTNRSSRRKQKGTAPLSANTPTPRNKCEHHSQNLQNCRARLIVSQGSVAHWVVRLIDVLGVVGTTQVSVVMQRGCNKSSKECHLMKECPKNRHGCGNLGNRDQSL